MLRMGQAKAHRELETHYKLREPFTQFTKVASLFQNQILELKNRKKGFLLALKIFYKLLIQHPKYIS